MHKYPKLLFLCFCITAAYLAFQLGVFNWIGHAFNGRGYFSMFLGGLFFGVGFTSPFGVGIFVAMAKEVDPLLGALLGGTGALLADLGIFSLIRFSIFHDELHSLRSTRMFLRIEELLHHERISEKMRQAILWSFAGILIASPLPDEFGAMLVGSATHVRSRDFGLLCFILNTLGIFLILSIARS